MEFAPDANEDSDQIFLDGERRFGFGQADAFRREMFEALRVLAAKPAIGVSLAPELAGYRMYADLKPVRIIYRFDHESIVVIRIMHRRQDMDAILSDLNR